MRYSRAMRAVRRSSLAVLTLLALAAPARADSAAEPRTRRTSAKRGPLRSAGAFKVPPPVKLPPAREASKLPPLWLATSSGWTDVNVSMVQFGDDLRTASEIQVRGTTAAKQALSRWIGQSATVGIRLRDGTRYLHGYVVEAGSEQPTGGARTLDLTIRTWPALLSKVAGSEVFERGTIPEVIRKIVERHPLASFEVAPAEAYPERPLIVQYRETDLNALSRMLEDVGMFMITRHDAKGHKVVFTDAQPTRPARVLDARQSSGEGSVTSWTRREQVRASRYIVRSTLGRDALTGSARDTALAGPLSGMEIYDYEQAGLSQREADRVSRLRLDELAASEVAIAGMTEDPRLAAGDVFELRGHASDDGLYLVTGTTQTFSAAGGGQPVAANVMFRAIPAAARYRSSRQTPEPIIDGLQLALVRQVSKDRPGQVRVWFRWDRAAKARERGSAWVTVSPRIDGAALAAGDWVIVGFGDGDVDLPMVTAVAAEPKP